MTRLPYCSKFTYGDGKSLLMDFPITVWNRSAVAIGGDVEADSRMRASFIVRRDEMLSFSLRFYEASWPTIQAFLDEAMTGALITWYLDRSDAVGIPCYLESPAVGENYATSPDSAYPRLILLPITLVRPGGVAWELPSYTARDPIGPPGYIVHDFSGVTTTEFVVISGTGEARALLIGGGGGGGAADGSGVYCGGGGAGGMLDVHVAITPGTYPIHIGQGGAGGFGDHTIASGTLADDYGDRGESTTFAGRTAIGGGGGGTNLYSAVDVTVGGSGGGVFSINGADAFGNPSHPPIVQTTAENGTPGQGHRGGYGVNDSGPMGGSLYGGGGGGAGGNGFDYVTGEGGPGQISDITGEEVYYAGGGGGGHGLSGGTGGIGGGGHGGAPAIPGGQGTQGEDGLGGGGGGGGGVVGAQGSRGGHGRVIIRYTIASAIFAVGGTISIHPDD